jgi:hypothetical protein
MKLLSLALPVVFLLQTGLSPTQQQKPKATYKERSLASEAGL